MSDSGSSYARRTKRRKPNGTEKLASSTQHGCMPPTRTSSEIESPTAFVRRMYAEAKWRELTPDEAAQLYAYIKLMSRDQLRLATRPTSAFSGDSDDGKPR